MIDITRRMEYADVFDFDKFHEVFRQQVIAAKGGECIILASFIDDHHEVWHDYRLTKTTKIADVLAIEVAEMYGLYPDPDDRIILPKYKKQQVKKDTEPTIRGLAKEFLESNAKPQKLQAILDYVNSHRKSPTTRPNLSSSLIQDKNVFVHFNDANTWGLLSKPYKNHSTCGESDIINYGHSNDAVWCAREESIFRTDLSSQNYEFRYSSKREHKPTEFFTKALINSSHLDLGLGYFSSACFNVLACGFAHFVKNGGNMRMYINPSVTEDDYKLLKNSDYEGFEQYMIQSYDRLLKIFSRRDELFFRCLSYLISQHRIEVKIVMLKEDGIAHEKFGIFADTEGNEVAFNGSMNLTASGLTKNIEAIDTICSWRSDDDRERIKGYHDDFESIWENRNPDIMVFPAEEFCNRILVTYPTSDIDDLVKLENVV